MLDPAKGDMYTGRVCKACKNAAQAAKRVEAAEKRPPRVYETMEEWQSRGDEKGKYEVPCRDRFASEAEFQRATHAYNERKRHGGIGRKSQREYADASNAAKRRKWEHMSPADKAAWKARADANKQLSRGRALADGLV